MRTKPVNHLCGLSGDFFRLGQIIIISTYCDVIYTSQTILCLGSRNSDMNLTPPYNVGGKSTEIPHRIAQVGAPQGSEQRSRPPRDAEPRGTGCVRPRGLRLLGILRLLGENTWATQFYRKIILVSASNAYIFNMFQAFLCHFGNRKTHFTVSLLCILTSFFVSFLYLLNQSRGIILGCFDCFLVCLKKTPQSSFWV